VTRVAKVKIAMSVFMSLLQIASLCISKEAAWPMPALTSPFVSLIEEHRLYSQNAVSALSS
jgi:hypothetical protein